MHLLKLAKKTKAPTLSRGRMRNMTGRRANGLKTLELTEITKQWVKTPAWRNAG